MCIIGSMIEKHSNAKMQVWQRGFKYTLTNGYTLSCAFGYGNYCDNRHDHSADLANKDCHKVESSDFEVAVVEPVRENFKDAEIFKGKLHARCHMFRRICKDFMDKADKETANAKG